MKHLVAITAVGVLILSTGRIESQSPRPQSPEQALSAIKASNAALLEKQKATLQKLDTLSTEADQLRIFSKRG
jgi:hypothetical protein